ncbi:hypothetical protein Hrubri_0971 [Herbaspirillum rubrisubalbicans M1]|uniref:hypothetical protein n=1 Tax=Herbaspirillum rubrisubalbicans TaxID=80842 RepID=UPI00073AB55A|nr:hypothetical protein [Herbaspirillum rubrisubalbicans]ALU88187.1 hypothetical protein Hrubri_0971 [Herbaspirillum rubrisubalbicans M1]
MAATKRSQNTCKDCHYTWYPKGKNLSRECPNCKSKNVKIVGPGLGSILGGIIAIGIAVAMFGGNKKTEEAVRPVIAPTETVSVQPPVEVSTPTPPTAVKSAHSAEAVIVPERQEQVPTAAPMADNERVVSEEELKQMKAQAAEQDQSPTSNAASATDTKY